jgi:hypothetical protein
MLHALSYQASHMHSIHACAEWLLDETQAVAWPGQLL